MAAVLGLAACSGAVDPAPGSINDPYESVNRRIHERTKSTDRAVVRPVAVSYATNVPRGVQAGIGNFATNFATPGMVVNDILQMQAEDALVNSYRFAVNTVLGLGGLIDVAGLVGVPLRKTDFGETLHFWRVQEGAYLSLPVLGPSTERDLAGRAGDLFLNPLSYLIPSPERYVATAAGAIDRVGERGRYASKVDGLLHDGTDSYARTRDAYLQARRSKLSGGDESDLQGAGGADADPYLAPVLDPDAE